MLTLNQIVKKLEDIKSRHHEVNSFYFGDPYEIGAKEAVVYPLMGAALNPGSIDGNIVTTRMLLFLADKVEKDEGNETEVISNMRNTALGVYTMLRSYLHKNKVQVTGAGFSSFTEEWDDEVSGWQIELTITQFLSHNECAEPTYSFLAATDNTNILLASGGRIILT